MTQNPLLLKEVLKWICIVFNRQFLFWPSITRLLFQRHRCP